MKIKYDEPENLFKFYNETVEIGQKRKKIEKNGNANIVNQIVKYSLMIILFGLYNVIFIYLKSNDIIGYILKALSIFFFIYYIFYLITFIVNYIKFKKNSIKGTITINENSFIDEDEKYKFEIRLDEISSVIIGKYSINIIISNSVLYFRIPITYKDKILNAITKYKSDIKIINLFD